MDFTTAKLLLNNTEEQLRHVEDMTEEREMLLEPEFQSADGESDKDELEPHGAPHSCKLKGMKEGKTKANNAARRYTTDFAFEMHVLSWSAERQLAVVLCSRHKH